MSQAAYCRTNAPKWMRAPSNCTRIVVIACGLDSDHIDLIHQGFSCFDNVALIHVDAAHTGPGQLAEVRGVKGDYCFVVLGEVDEGLLHDLSIGQPRIYPIAPDGAAERSVIAAVEQVKHLARVNRPHPLEALSETCRSDS